MKELMPAAIEPMPDLLSFYPALNERPKIDQGDLFMFILGKSVKYCVWAFGSLGILAAVLLCLALQIGLAVMVLVGAAVIGAIVGTCIGMPLGLIAMVFYPMRSSKPFMLAVNSVLLLCCGAIVGTIGIQSALVLLAVLMMVLFSFVNVLASRAMQEVGVTDRYAAPNPLLFLHGGNLFHRQIYEEMPYSYAAVERWVGLGLLARWREALLGLVDLRPGMRVVDLMSGAGQMSAGIWRRVGQGGHLTMVDYVGTMLRLAPAGGSVRLLCESCMATSLPSGQADVVTCAFGVAALEADEQEQLVGEIDRILAPNGVVGVLDLSLPRLAPLRWAYLFYLSTVLPWVGQMHQNIPLLYQLLPRYLRDFPGVAAMLPYFVARGYAVSLAPLDGGLATALVAMKPGDGENRL